MKQKLKFAMLIATTLLASCSSLTKPSSQEPKPLVIASCPELTPLSDDTFGATVQKLITVTAQYYECRTAALAGPHTLQINK